MQCKKCGVEFTPARSDAVYCSQACRQSAYRERSSEPVTRQVTDRAIQSDYNPVAPLNTAFQRAMDAIPKKHHAELGFLAQTAAIVVEQWVKAELEVDSTHAEYREKLDDEWEKIEKARAELVRREADFNKAVMKYEGVEIGGGQVMHLWREGDLRAMRSFLHEDKHQDPDMKDKARALFSKWRALEDKVMAWSKKCTIPELESYGWTKTVAERRAKKAKA